MTRRWLATRGRGALKSLILAFCAGDALVLDKIDVGAVAGRIEDYLAALPLGYLLMMKSLLLLAGVPMSWLPLQRRARFLEGWAESRRSWKRMSFYALKFVCCKEIYAEPRLLASIGYGPAMLERLEGRCSSTAPV